MYFYPLLNFLIKEIKTLLYNQYIYIKMDKSPTTASTSLSDE